MISPDATASPIDRGAPLEIDENSRERLAFAVDAGRVGMWEFDVAAGVLTTSPLCREIFGRDPALPFSFEDWRASVHPDDLARLYGVGAAGLRTGIDFAFEYRISRPDGPGSVDVRAQVWRAADGTPLRITGSCLDVTRRVRAQAMDRALIALEDRLRIVESPADLAYAGAEILGRTLDVSRAGYGTIDPVAETITIERDWNAPGIASLAGVLHFRDYGSYIEDLKRGETVVFADAEKDPRTAAGAASLKAISAQAVINMPVTEEEGLVALLYLNHAEARPWLPEELTFVREAAYRVRMAVERRRAEQELRALTVSLERQVETRTRERDRLWQVSRDLLGVTDGAGVWLSVNPAWTRVLGWPPDQVIGRDSAWIRHPEDAPEPLAALAVLAPGNSLSFESRMRGRDQHYRTLSWTIIPVEDLRYCVARDVTEERARERALNDQRDFARLALSAVAGVGVWTFDVATDRFTCDAAIADLYGLDRDAAATGIARERFLGNVHPDDLATLRTTMAGGLHSAGDLELEYRLVHPDGRTRWVLSRGHTYFDGEGHPVRRTGVGVETTRLHELEEQLRQSQKMEAVGQLTGGLAHDFNNLLAGISGSLELMQARLKQGRVGELERFLTAAQGAATRAAALTHRLLAFSRRQTLDPRPTDVNQLIGGLLDLLHRTVGPAVTIGLVEEPALWPALIDPNQLESALLNLCINARDAMPDGGPITIATANRTMDAAAARERELEAGEYLAICVTDTGAGMTPEVIARAFDPFFTTKPIGQGTGLGLSMIYGFARQSGGQVRIRSVPGAGTTICLYLPRHRPAGEVTAADAAPSAPTVAADEGETVLVVEDELTVRLLIIEVLRDLGYRTIEAGNGAAALTVLRSAARIDLLVTDVGLPGGMNGRQVADAGRDVRPALKVLFITGYAENAAVGNGDLAPGMHVMTKPFVMEALAARIRAIIEGA